MDSSISHSRAAASKVPQQSLFFLLIAIVTGAVCGVYVLYLNPEILFFKNAAMVKENWAKGFPRPVGKVIFSGDSNCAFSLNTGSLTRDYKMPAVNAGLAAGMGSLVLASFGRSLAEPSDTLILNMAPGLLTDSAVHTALGVQFSYAVNHSEWVTESDLDLAPMNRVSSLLQLRPGAQHVFALLGKAILGRALYRYGAKDVEPDGWMHTDVRMEIVGPPGRGPHLSREGVYLLVHLKIWCEEHKVRLAYSLPWGYVPDSALEDFQRDNRAFLREVVAIVPVLKDSHLGAWSRVEDFGDTMWHLRDSGVTQRTREVAREVSSWDTWRSEDLQD